MSAALPGRGSGWRRMGWCLLACVWASAAWGHSFTAGTGMAGEHQVGYSALVGGTANPGGTIRAWYGWEYRLLGSPVAVVGRWVFYNQSVWDGNSAAANAADDAAIATDKRALLPGGKASITNYTSYSRGLNGLMVDISGLPGNPSASDFLFRTGNVATLANWAAGPAPSSVTVRKGAGVDGSDRVTLIWGADAVKKRWLEVKVRATEATGLGQDDVFYFGNAIGEVGNSTTDARVTAVDALRVLVNVAASVGVTNRFDVNRDGRVGAADRLIILGNLSAIDPLVLLNLSAGAAPALLGRSPPATGAEIRILGLRAEDAGMRLRWVEDGSPMAVWTAVSVNPDEWEILEVIESEGGPGTYREMVLPVEPDGERRFYRLESLRDGQ